MDPDRRSHAGPFNADDIEPDSGYELYDGHPVRCFPMDGDVANTVAAAVQAITSDPDADETGVDAGYCVDGKNVFATDIAVGNVPDRRGFISGVPALAIEYVGEHQDEVRLQDKIAHFLAGGTHQIWVVRLIGPRRVEVYRPDAAPITLAAGQMLRAPGVLRNELPVEALFDRQKAREIAFRNLLAEAGYDGLDAVRGEGREEGREEGRARGLREAVIAALGARGLELDDTARAVIEAEGTPETLLRWLARAVSAGTVAEVICP